MKVNPYGSSCGTSTVVAPRNARASISKLGTAGARLSDTNSGKALRRPRTKEELESMDRHPAGKALEVEPLPQPVCTCKDCKRDARQLQEAIDLFAACDLEEWADDLRAKAHQIVEENLREEEMRTIVGRRAREERLRLFGDNDM